MKKFFKLVILISSLSFVGLTLTGCGKDEVATPGTEVNAGSGAGGSGGSGGGSGGSGTSNFAYGKVGFTEAEVDQLIQYVRNSIFPQQIHSRERLKVCTGSFCSFGSLFSDWDITLIKDRRDNYIYYDGTEREFNETQYMSIVADQHIKDVIVQTILDKGSIARNGNSSNNEFIIRVLRVDVLTAVHEYRQRQNAKAFQVVLTNGDSYLFSMDLPSIYSFTGNRVRRLANDFQ